VIARRAASIWRAVIRSGSMALRPKAPKLSSVPTLGVAVDAALEGLAELGALGLQHVLLSFALTGCRALRGAGRTPEVCASIISRS
jgi:predicted small secreted protein